MVFESVKAARWRPAGFNSQRAIRSRYAVSRICRVRCSLEPAEDDSTCHRAARHLKPEKEIGSDYGEGFSNFKIRDGMDHVDVDRLNLLMRTKGAERLRHALKPDQAIGVIFCLEGVLADTRSLKESAWRLVAKEECLEFPEIARPQIYELPPERTVTEVFMWTNDWSEARRLARKCGDAYVSLFNSLGSPRHGTVEWLSALQRNQVPCAVVSTMGRSSVRTVLSTMGILDFFLADVCFEDGMDTLAQSYLSASMKLQRPPNQCVVFTNSPKGIAAAHNCTMKTIAMLGDYKGYQLKQGDLTCSSMDELSVYNLRRLFANRGGEFMDTTKEKDGNTRPLSVTRVGSEDRV